MTSFSRAWPTLLAILLAILLTTITIQALTAQPRLDISTFPESIRNEMLYQVANEAVQTQWWSSHPNQRDDSKAVYRPGKPGESNTKVKRRPNGDWLYATWTHCAQTGGCTTATLSFTISNDLGSVTIHPGE